MRNANFPSAKLTARLNRQGIGGYLKVGRTTPWAHLEEALPMADVDDMSPQAIHAFLDMEGGEWEVKWYADSILTE
jgi:hypothetical protein